MRNQNEEEEEEESDEEDNGDNSNDDKDDKTAITMRAFIFLTSAILCHEVLSSHHDCLINHDAMIVVSNDWRRFAYLILIFYFRNMRTLNSRQVKNFVSFLDLVFLIWFSYKFNLT